MNPVSKEEFKAMLDRQQQSGLSIRDFCINESFNRSSFHYWKSKYGFARPYNSHCNQTTVQPAIAPVSIKSPHLSSVEPSNSVENHKGEITIKFPGGVEVSFSGQAQSEIAIQMLNQICTAYVLSK